MPPYATLEGFWSLGEQRHGGPLRQGLAFLNLAQRRPKGILAPGRGITPSASASEERHGTRAGARPDVLPNLAALRLHNEAPTALFKELTKRQAEKRKLRGAVCPITIEPLEARKGREHHLHDGATFRVKRRGRRGGFDWFDAKSLARWMWADIQAGRTPRNPVNRDRMWRNDMDQLKESYPRQLSPDELLFTAIQKNDTDGVVDALGLGASLTAHAPDEEDYEDVTPLGMWAMTHNCPIAIFNALRQQPGFEVDAEADCDESPALQVAIYSDHNGKNAYKVKALLAANADVNLANENNDRALAIAAAEAGTEMIEEVWPNTIDVNARNEDGQTALFMAANENLEENVAYLLTLSKSTNKTIEVNIGSDEYASPLHVAIKESYRGVVELLLQNGADMNKSWEGMSLFQFALDAGDAHIIDIIRSHPRYVPTPDEDAELPMDRELRSRGLMTRHFGAKSEPEA